MNVTHAANDLPLPSLVLEELKKSGLTAQRLNEAQVFCQAFFARIAASDADLHTPEQWTVLIGGLLHFMQKRQAGTALVRVLNPADSHAGRSLLQIVTDDMPFLVDTVSMIVSTKLQIHAVIHPMLKVVRDASGELLGIGGEAGPAESAKPESVMHFEIDRVADEAEQAQLIAQVEAALDDVRVAVSDWAAMREIGRAHV